MANEQDNVAGLVAGILIAGETQRQAEQGPSSFRVETNGDNRWWS